MNDNDCGCLYDDNGIFFWVPGIAQPAGSKRAFPRGGHVSVVDANPKAKSWKGVVGLRAELAMGGHPPFDGPLTVMMTFNRSRPKAHIGKHGVLPSAPDFPTVKPDLLKLARAVEDAMTGIVYRDDAQIVAEWLWKKYGEQDGVMVSVTRTIIDVPPSETDAQGTEP
jgi:Holliday junction resolvase RusA-like endonuclease